MSRRVADGISAAGRDGDGSGTGSRHLGTKDVFCKYYLNNVCTQGSACPFSHDRNSGASQPSSVCNYYLAGKCNYGSGCKYDHVRPSSTRSVRPLASNINATPNNNRNRNPSSASAAAPSAKSNSLPKPGTQMPPLKSRLNPNAVEFKPRATLVEQQRQAIIDEDFESKVSVPIGMDQLQFGMTEAAGTSSVSGNQPSYAAVVGEQANNDVLLPLLPPASVDILCPYHLIGNCYFAEKCAYLHGDICDLCQQPVLHPTDGEQRKKHKMECTAEHEAEMVKAFSLANTADKQCGVCMEIVVEKVMVSNRRFGILQNCKHVFCLECIRKWRQSNQFENQIIRACPECRVKSDYVIPSKLWVEDDDEKQKMIVAYKASLNQKHCKYFKRGAFAESEECPFGSKCFYRHELPDGTTVKGESPQVIRRRKLEQQRRRGVGEFLMWDYLRRRVQDNDDLPAWFRSRPSSIFNDSDDEWIDPSLIDFDWPFYQGWSTDEEDLDGDELDGDYDGVYASFGRGRPNGDDADIVNVDDWINRSLENELNLLALTGGNSELNLQFTFGTGNGSSGGSSSPGDNHNAASSASIATGGRGGGRGGHRASSSSSVNVSYQRNDFHANRNQSMNDIGQASSSNRGPSDNRRGGRGGGWFRNVTNRRNRNARY